MLTTTQAAQVHQTATHAEHATHRDDSRLSIDRSLSKTVQSLFCFLVLVSSLVLVPYGMGGFIRGYMGFDRVSPTGVTWAFEATSLTTAKRRMCYVLLVFDFLLFRRMRLMRICVCVDMRYGMGVLGKMYMNAMDMDMEVELRGTVNIMFGFQHLYWSLRSEPARPSCWWLRRAQNAI